MDIQKKRGELTKTFMMISNLKIPLVFMVYTTLFKRSSTGGLMSYVIMYIINHVSCCKAGPALVTLRLSGSLPAPGFKLLKENIFIFS